MRTFEDVFALLIVFWTETRVFLSYYSACPVRIACLDAIIAMLRLHVRDPLKLAYKQNICQVHRLGNCRMLFCPQVGVSCTHISQQLWCTISRRMSGAGVYCITVQISFPLALHTTLNRVHSFPTLP